MSQHYGHTCCKYALGRSIGGQYSGHVTSFDQYEASLSSRDQFWPIWGQFIVTWPVWVHIVHMHKVGQCYSNTHCRPDLTLTITIPIHMYAHVLKSECFFPYTSCFFHGMYFSYLELILTHGTGEVLRPLWGLDRHDENLGNHCVVFLTKMMVYTR